MWKVFTIVLISILIVVAYKNNFFVKDQLPIVPQTNSTIQPSSPNSAISKGDTPSFDLKVPSEYVIHIFASDLGNPRDLEYSPGGTLLVSNPNNGVVYALPDKNNDGVADENKIVISDENHPHGLAFYNNQLFIADTDKVVRYNWNEKTLTATKDKVLFSLPGNNNHNNRTIILDRNGTMYVSVGSTCNVCKESDNRSATIMISDTNGSNPKVFATGLRNAPFMVFNPTTHQLWVTEMGRDNLGDNIPPDEIDIVQRGKDYGWPYCYGNRIHDNEFDPNKLHSCIDTISPIYEIPAHSAPLGLTFIDSPQFPDWKGDLLAAYHGSWNRSTPDGYKVVRLKVNRDTISNSEDFLTGFAPSSTLNIPGNATNSAPGRPVDVIFDAKGNLYVSDDKAGNIYIIQKN